MEILSKKQEGSSNPGCYDKQNIEKVLGEHKPLWGRISTLFREQGITIISILTALSTTISTIALAITGVFGGARGRPCCFCIIFTKRRRNFEKMVKQAKRRPQKTCWKDF